MAIASRRIQPQVQACWEGPYLLDDIHPDGRAGRLRDIQSGALVKVKASGAKERVHLDDVKVFVPRLEMPDVNTVELRDWKPPGDEMLSFNL
jgi:hypothetical protein